jgi:capsular exopolysaccharide synthesis family protein
MAQSQSSAMDFYVLRRKKWVVVPMDYLYVLWRRKWVVVQFLLLGPLIALVFTLRQAPEYEATAGVLLHLDHGDSLAPRTSAAPSEDPARVVQNEARRAASLPIAERAVRATWPAFTSPGQLLDHSTVSTNEGIDVLTIAVRHSERVSALGVADAYARQFALYLQNAQTMAHSQALARVKKRLTEMRRQGRRDALYRSLRVTEQQLEVVGSLNPQPASVIPVAHGAAKVQPRPVRNAVLGFGIGLLLGLAAAFLWEALDGRIRSEEEVAELLGLPLLGRIRESSRSRRVAMLESPNSPHAESFRILRVALDTLNHDVGARTLMVTSAFDGEGKSTTAANLAVAYARSGLRVILVDLDLRAPSLGRLFGLEGRAGVKDVAVGHVPLDAALAEVPVVSSSGSLNGDASYRGSLHVLPAGPVSRELREMVLVHSSAELLAQLRSQVDVVLIDAPPIVPVVDAQALAAHVDRLLVVIRWSFARRRTLKELRRTLVASGAPPVGFVLVAGAGEMTEPYSGPEPRTPFSRTMRPTTAKVTSESSAAWAPRTKTGS